MSTPPDLAGLVERNPVSGYTAGTFDLFHIGHLKLLKRARDHCDRLIVGVSIDELVAHTKGKWPVVPFEERVEIVRAIRFVDDVVAQVSMDKLVAWKSTGFDRLFVGDDYLGSSMWERFEREFRSSAWRSSTSRTPGTHRARCCASDCSICPSRCERQRRRLQRN